MTESSEDAEIKEAFKIFDKNADDIISFDELRHVLINLGENLKDDDVAEIIKAVNTSDNDIKEGIRFEDFYRMAKSGGCNINNIYIERHNTFLSQKKIAKHGNTF